MQQDCFIYFSGKKKTLAHGSLSMIVGKGKNSKKVKKEPSREEMHEVVVNILKQVDFNTVSTKIWLDGIHYGWLKITLLFILTFL